MCKSPEFLQCPLGPIAVQRQTLKTRNLTRAQYNPAKVTSLVATLEDMGPGPSYPKECPLSKVTSTSS